MASLNRAGHRRISWQVLRQDFIIWSASTDDAGEQWTLWSSRTLRYELCKKKKSDLFELDATVTVEPICDLYFASRSTPDRTGLEKHVLTLQKQNNIWRIVGDTSDMDSVSYPPGTDFDELTKTFPAHFAAWKNEQTQLAAQAETEASTMKRNGDQRFRLLDIQKSALSLP